MTSIARKYLTATASDADPIERDKNAEKRLAAYCDTYIGLLTPANFDYELWQSVEVVSGSVDASRSSGKAVFATSLPRKYYNSLGVVHGGAIATLFDGLTNCSIALVMRSGFWENSAMTRHLNVTYLSPVKEGQKIVVECEIVRASGRLATVTGVMKRAGDDMTLALCLSDMTAVEKGKL